MNQVLRPLVPQQPNIHTTSCVISLEHDLFYSNFNWSRRLRARIYRGTPVDFNSRLDGCIKDDTPLDW
jgi:hypothetical protein